MSSVCFGFRACCYFFFVVETLAMKLNYAFLGKQRGEMDLT